MQKITQLPLDIEKYESRDRKTIYTACVLMVLHKLGGEAYRRDIMQKVKEMEEVIAKKELQYFTYKNNRRGSTKEMYKFQDEEIMFGTTHLSYTKYVESSKSKNKGVNTRGLWVLVDSKKVRDIIDKLVSNSYDEKQFMSVLNDTIATIEQEVEDYWKDRKGREKEQKEQEQSIKQEAQEQRTQQDAVLKNLNDLSPSSFERYCVQLCNAVGGAWETKTEKAEQKDGGVDLIGYVNMGVVKIRVVAQVKIRTTSSITEKDMRLFIGDKVVHNAQNGVFITTADFALPAQALAKIHDITLINGEALVRLIEEHKLQKLLKDTLYKQDKK